MRYVTLALISFAFVALAVSGLAAVPENGTACGVPVQRWICSYMADGPGSKPAGWYTPSSAIPAGKTIYRSCQTVCLVKAPVLDQCVTWGPAFVERAPHANDVVLASGARRAYCGSSSSHASEFWTLP